MKQETIMQGYFCKEDIMNVRFPKEFFTVSVITAS